MKKYFLASVLAISVFMNGSSIAFAAMTAPKEAYALLFRKKTLDHLPNGSFIFYRRDEVNLSKPVIAKNSSGIVELSLRKGQKSEVAHLRFLKDGKHRDLTDFPASVGNPMILYFVESVVRDMAQTADGSPYYIRNRMKEALVKPAQITTTTISYMGKKVPATRLTLYPFKGDPNAARMHGFDRLSVSATMSNAIPGWYQSLEAKAERADGTLIYHLLITFKSSGVKQ